MYTRLFQDFLASDYTLNIYKNMERIFTSKKDRLLPLLDYLEDHADKHEEVVVFDKLTGNAAALLCIKAHCREIFSPLGSKLAAETLDQYEIAYHFNETVPFIKQANGKDMCPMEQLSIGKGPEDFFTALKAKIQSVNS